MKQQFVITNPYSLVQGTEKKNLTDPLKTYNEAYMFVGKYRETLILTGVFVAHLSSNVRFSV